MAYRSVSHVAIRVEQLQEAEEFYCSFFGMEVAFREARTQDGWATLPEGAGWDDARAAGIDLELAVLHRDTVTIALEKADRPPEPNSTLSHIGLEIGEAEMAAVRATVKALGCQVRLDRPNVVVFDDPHGIRWEVTTAYTLRSTGVSAGRWLDVRRGSP